MGTTQEISDGEEEEEEEQEEEGIEGGGDEVSVFSETDDRVEEVLNEVLNSSMPASYVLLSSNKVSHTQQE